MEPLKYALCIALEGMINFSLLKVKDFPTGNFPSQLVHAPV